MSIEAMKQAKQVIAMMGVPNPLNFSKEEIIAWQKCNADLDQAIAEAEKQEPDDLTIAYMSGFHDGKKQLQEAEKQDNGKLKVTLQDTPTEIELAQYKLMFEAACSALGAVGDALGVDPEEGGAEPILAAIQELKAEKQEPVAIHQFRSPYCADWYDGVPDHHDGHGPYEVRTLYTSPPQRQPLYPREVKDVLRATGYVTNSQAWELAEEVMKLLAAHGIKGEA